MSVYMISNEGKTTLKGTLTELIKMNLSKTNTPSKDDSITSEYSNQEEELLIPNFDDPEVTITTQKEKEIVIPPPVVKEKLTIAQRRPLRETRSKPKRYIDPSTDSFDDEDDTKEGFGDKEFKENEIYSDSETNSNERIDKPDSDDLAFIADDAGSYSDDDEKEFVPGSDTASTDSIPDSSSESSSSTDFDEDELLSDDLSL